MEETQSSSNKRIAKNTLMLYVRMLLSMVVSLYTSRVVLNTLGVEDYGIYNVVGGVVAMFSFLNGSMSGATSRFLTFEMGRGDEKALKETFSTAMVIHVGIALIVLLLAETIGLWFLETKLIIPAERLNAARVVYQLSVLSTMLTITQVPYNACIIAHEKMDVYAYVEILNTVLKLLIVFLLLIVNQDRLIAYAILMLVVSVLITGIYRVYCLRKFSESKFGFIWKKSRLKPMLSFSGWDLYGNASVVLRQQGVSMVLNMFIGPVVNAANGLASLVNSVSMMFVNNVLIAFRPQIIKQYAAAEYKRMQSLLVGAFKICLTLYLILAIPLFFEMDFILQIWLGEVPMYTVDFCRILVITSCFSTITSIVNIGIHASGKMVLISCLSGTLIWMAVPIIYVLLRMGFHPNCAYITNCVVSILVSIANFFILKHNINQLSMRGIILQGVIKSLIIGFVDVMIIGCICRYLYDGWVRLIIACTVSLVVGVIVSWFILLHRGGRMLVVKRIKEIICKL